MPERAVLCGLQACDMNEARAKPRAGSVSISRGMLDTCGMTGRHRSGGVSDVATNYFDEGN